MNFDARHCIFTKAELSAFHKIAANKPRPPAPSPLDMLQAILADAIEDTGRKALLMC